MDEMKSFVLWCIETVPPVLLEPPISAFVGLALLFFTARLFTRMMHLI